MKILHVCLGNFYIDNYAYQENMLTKYHKKLGYEVKILASQVSFDENGKPCLLEVKEPYINEHGIPVIRLNYKKYPGSKKLRRYNGVKDVLDRFTPDIIFIHGCQFWDIRKIVNFIKKHPRTKVFVDNHADFTNSAKNWLSKNILHKKIWRKSAKLIEPYTTKFFGVLPARVDFLKNIYKIPKEKVELLLMGADDEIVKYAIKDNVREEIRNKHGIKENDFLIITGGKINTSKMEVLELIEAVQKIENTDVKLLIFGNVIPELKDQIERLVDNKKIIFVGWLNSKEVYEYFGASDLAVFPGRHSVLWEQAVGTGLPALFRYWEGTTHIDIGGNCKFIYKGTKGEIYNSIKNILEDNSTYLKMREVAMSSGIEEFSYQKIAEKSIRFK